MLNDDMQQTCHDKYLASWEKNIYNEAGFQAIAIAIICNI